MSATAQHRAKGHPNDIIYTPLPLALKTIELANIQPDETVLDPCKGKGVFYDNLSEPKYYCEITENKDFYDWTEPVDIVIGNPPFSHWNKWILHTLTICKKRFVYVMGATNLTARRLQWIIDAGFGITKIFICKVNWYMIQTMVIVAERGAISIMSGMPKMINCDVCNTNCKRGTYGFPPNECNLENLKLQKIEKMKLKKHTKIPLQNHTSQ